MAAFIRYVAFVFLALSPTTSPKSFTKNDLRIYRERVKEMFYHAYDSYIHNAYPYDELRPLSCDGVDTWGSFSLTLIDALDTLAVMGNFTEFRRVAKLLTEKAQFDMNINVSVFETNIRVVGGLLSAHLLSQKAGLELEDGWPCSGPLLRLAESVARRLLPAFNTPTKMPYGTVNLRHGVPKDETPITCTAGVTSYIVEFGTLSRLTGDPIFERVATDALITMWNARSPINLVGNHINVLTGAWTAVDSGIGGGVDSYYEYLVKGAILLQKPELMEMFQEYRKVIDRYMIRDDWYMWVNMQKGQITMPLFQSLEAYWPGVLSLVGDIESALKSIHNYHQVWKQYGFTPEFYNIPSGEANPNREGYPLRPELIESIMYLYRATNDPILVQMGVDILESIQHSAKTPCGYATIKDVRDHKVEDRMESFFLAETTKYLYLLFDSDNFIHGNGSKGTIFHTPNKKCILDVGNYVFNTEAHPIDVAAVHCCSNNKKEEDKLLRRFEDNIDLLSVYGLVDDDFLKPFRGNKLKLRERKKKNSETEIALEKNISDVVTVISKLKDDETKEENQIKVLSHQNDSIGRHNSQITHAEENTIEQTKAPILSEPEREVKGDDISQKISVNNINQHKLDFKEAKESKRAKSEEVNKYWLKVPKFKDDYSVLSCHVQPFLLRMSTYGEMFHVKV